MSLRSEITTVVVEWINNELITRLKEQLQYMDINASRSLSQSIHTDSVTIEESSIVASVVGEAYWKYVNYGVNGFLTNHNAPTWGHTGGTIQEFRESILDWIPARGIYKPDKFKTYDDFANAIVWNLMRKGKEPRPFVNEAIKEVSIEELKSKLITIFVDELKKKR